MLSGELLGARATRLPPRSREVVPRGSIREALHLSRRQHENAPRASTPERRALRCARCGQGPNSSTRALRRRRPSRITDCLPVSWTSSSRSAPRLSIIRRSRRARASRVLVAEFVRRMPLANVPPRVVAPPRGYERARRLARRVAVRDETINLQLALRAHEHNLARDSLTLRLEVRLQHASRVRRVTSSPARAAHFSHAFEVASERVVRLRRAALRPPSAALVPPRLPPYATLERAGRHLAEGVEESRGDARRRHLQKRRANLNEAGRATSQREWRRRSR